MNHNDETGTNDELMALAASLPRAVSPQRDLWPGIETAIRLAPGPARGLRHSIWAQAAAVVLLVAGSSGITYRLVKDDAAYRGPEVVTPDTVFDRVLFEPLAGQFGQRYTLGNEYLAARDQLESKLDQSLQSMAPESRENVVDDLNAIRVAIRDINAALVKEPDNILLQKLLLRSYHEEISLLTKIDGIANAAMRRNDI